MLLYHLTKLIGSTVLLILASTGCVKGQLCSGSLGDPVVLIDFGRGTGTGQPLKAATTTYSYLGTDCPSDGFYTLGNRTANCFNNTWHTLTEDHTLNDANGYFMLVNASFQPGDFYVDTVRALCINTTYEFAAWVVNVLKPGGFCGNGIDPDLTFSIETKTGTVLAKQNSGNIPESGVVEWKQYGVFFKTPIDVTDVVVRITNNAPGGCGNDIALDDITFRPCGPMVNAIVSSNGKDTAVLCEGDKSSLLLTSNYTGGYSSPTLQWQESTDMGLNWRDIPGAVSLTYTRPPTTGTGSFLYKMLIGESANFISPSCRTASNVVKIDIYALPVIDFAAAVSGCDNKNFKLSVTGGSTYNWTGPNGFTSSLATVDFSPLKMDNAGLYNVLATSDKGCSSSGATALTVLPSPTAMVSPDMNICEGSSTNLAATGGVQYEWTPSKGLSNPSISNPRAEPTDSTIYKVVVKNQFGCADTASIAVNVWKKPVASAGPDKRMKVGAQVELEGAAKGSNITYYWTPAGLSDPTSLKPKANPAQSTTYTLHVVSGVGCGTATDETKVQVYEIPNAFSPNADGTNDTWAIKSPEAFDGSDIQIFNRYGQIVFRSKGYATAWNGTYNGKPVPVGTYYYVIDLNSGLEPNITGWIFLVR